MKLLEFNLLGVKKYTKVTLNNFTKENWKSGRSAKELNAKGTHTTDLKAFSSYCPDLFTQRVQY